MSACSAILFSLSHLLWATLCTVCFTLCKTFHTLQNISHCTNHFTLRKTFHTVLNSSRLMHSAIGYEYQPLTLRRHSAWHVQFSFDFSTFWSYHKYLPKFRLWNIVTFIGSPSKLFPFFVSMRNPHWRNLFINTLIARPFIAWARRPAVARRSPVVIVQIARAARFQLFK